MSKKFAHVYQTENGGYIVDYLAILSENPPRDELKKDAYETLDKVLKKLGEYFQK